LTPNCWRHERFSQQRGWLRPDNYGLVLERAHLDHHDQKVTFTGEKLLADPAGHTLHADTEQPRFYVERAVGGSEQAPLNLWRIVHLTDHKEQRLIDQFSRMWQSPWLPKFVEIYIRTDLHLGLTRRNRQRQEHAETAAIEPRAVFEQFLDAISRLDDERVLLTGVGLVHGIAAETLAVVRLHGDVEEGRLEDSFRQIVGMHAAVYRSRAAATSVVHTHSPQVTAFALARTPLPSRYEALHPRGQTAAVPVVPWAPRGSTEANDGIAQTLRDHPDTWAVLLANHGLLACGSSPQDAARLVVVPGGGGRGRAGGRRARWCQGPPAGPPDRPGPG
jgi:ribulose-5-phosphate 4-epimerase/fuculose-1-phosphate aldolase